MSKQVKILVSGGGTGGHIFPAIAIANAIKKMRPDVDFLFVGASGRMEMEKIPAAGYPIVGLPVAGFQRKLSPGNIMKNILFPFKLVFSMMKALMVVVRFKPDLAIGTGGYASGPVLKICGWMGVPYVLQEQNSLPGVTNKLLGIHAKAVCVAFDHMEQYFAKEKIHVTGNPVRENLAGSHISREEAMMSFGFSLNKKTVFVTGGSLGAGPINEGIAAGMEELIKQDIQVIWQCGKFYLEQYKKFEHAQVRVLDFIKDMDKAYAAADIIVSRAGGTISELAIVGKPTILLPSPNVAEDHQTKNVQALVEKNATVLIKDQDAKANLVKEIISLCFDEMRKEQLSNNIKGMAKPNAAKDIASLALSIIEQKN